MTNKPIIPPHNPCLNCPDPPAKLSMDSIIAVGFGSAFLECDGKIVFEERHDDREFHTVQEAEELAAKDPERDWRIHMHGPLHGEVWQRQGKENWVCIEHDEGFA